MHLGSWSWAGSSVAWYTLEASLRTELTYLGLLRVQDILKRLPGDIKGTIRTEMGGYPFIPWQAHLQYVKIVDTFISLLRRILWMLFRHSWDWPVRAIGKSWDHSSHNQVGFMYGHLKVQLAWSSIWCTEIRRKGKCHLDIISRRPISAKDSIPSLPRLGGMLAWALPMGLSNIPCYYIL